MHRVKTEMLAVVIIYLLYPTKGDVFYNFINFILLSEIKQMKTKRPPTLILLFVSP